MSEDAASHGHTESVARAETPDPYRPSRNEAIAAARARVAADRLRRVATPERIIRLAALRKDYE